MSCSEDTDYFSKEFSIEENSLTKGINENDLKNAFYLKGNFKIWKTNNNEIVVYSKTPDEVNHFFILQTDSDDSKETISLPPKINNVLFLNHSMVLSFGKNHYYFGVSKKEEKSILNSLSKNTDFITLNYGIGLVHSWFGKDSHVSKNMNINSLISSKNSVIDELSK